MIIKLKRFLALRHRPFEQSVLAVVDDDVLLLLLVLGTTFVLLDLCKIQKTYKNNKVDTSDTRYCAKFQPFVTSIHAKN